MIFFLFHCILLKIDLSSAKGVELIWLLLRYVYRQLRSSSIFCGSAAIVLCMSLQAPASGAAVAQPEAPHDSDDIVVLYEKMVQLSIPLLNIQAWGVEVFVDACEVYEMVRCVEPESILLLFLNVNSPSGLSSSEGSIKSYLHVVAVSISHSETSVILLPSSRRVCV